MKLNKLSLRDKKYFDGFLKKEPHGLSVYAFETIYISRALFDIYWAEIKDSLCVFFEDETGCFLYLPPLSRGKNKEAIGPAFEIMRGRNRNSPVTRIENAEEKDLAFYRGLGYEAVYKSCDYVSQREDVAGLKGDKFSGKRSSFNYFIKNYKFDYMPFSAEYKKECVSLYDLWAEERRGKTKDPVYQRMLEDNKVFLKELLSAYESLGCEGGVVIIDGELKGFTIGFELASDTFCVLYEVTDISVKGLAQFIFTRFCSCLPHPYINMCDDSGLDNLRKVKLSYHPQKIIPAYIIREKQ